MNELQIRVHGSPALPTLIYLPGIHGDWTLVSSFRAALAGKVRFVEITYPHATTWMLEDYAAGIEKALTARGITEGWLIGESFGSQPAWQIVQRANCGGSKLAIHGLILAGGFVKHPWPWGAKFLRWASRVSPRFLFRALFKFYSLYSRFRHRYAPESYASVQEFIRNRFAPGDAEAIRSRYTLIVENDLCAIAKAAKLPVFALAGLIDPMVPNAYVRRWLKANCPGFREAKTLHASDHNVLGTAPDEAAQIVMRWITSAGPLPENGSGRDPFEPLQKT